MHYCARATVVSNHPRFAWSPPGGSGGLTMACSRLGNAGFVNGLFFFFDCTAFINFLPSSNMGEYFDRCYKQVHVFLLASGSHMFLEHLCIPWGASIEGIRGGGGGLGRARNSKGPLHLGLEKPAGLQGLPSAVGVWGHERRPTCHWDLLCLAALCSQVS